MTKRLLILLALAAVVWAAAYLVPARQGERDALEGTVATRADEPAPAPWPAFADEAVRRVVQNSTQADFALGARDGQWFLTAVPEAPEQGFRADGDKVRALLQFVSANKPRRRLKQMDPGDVSQTAPYGLDKPWAVLTIQGRDAPGGRPESRGSAGAPEEPGSPAAGGHQTWTLRLGAENTAGDGVYALASHSGSLLLLDARYRTQAVRTPAHYLDLRLTGLEPDQVRAVRVEGPGVEAWEIARRDKAREEDPAGPFAFTWPQALTGYAVSASEMELYLHTVTSMKAAAPAPERYRGPEAELPPYAAVRVVPVLGEPVLLEVLGPVAAPSGGEEGADREARSFVVRSSWQTAPMLLDRERVDKLLRSAFSLRARKVVDMDLGEIIRQELRQRVANGGNATVELVAVKTGEGWQAKDTGRALLGLDMLLWRLTDLKYEARPRQALPNTAEPFLAWRLYNGKERPKVALQFYLDPELPRDQCWLKVQGRDHYYPVLDQLLEDLQGLLPAASPDGSAAGDTQTR